MMISVATLYVPIILMTFPLSRRHFITLSALASLAVPVTSRAATPPLIVTTIGQIAEPLKTILAENAVVAPLIKGNLDPHSYIPVRSDIRLATRANVFVYNGLNLEAQMRQLIAQLHTNKHVFALGEYAQDNIISTSYNGKPALDPHMWMNPLLWSHLLSTLWKDLETLYPDIVNDSQPAFLAYMENLYKLHLYAQETLNTIPSHQRILVTSHDAFGYFGKAYGLGVYGIQGISTQSEASIHTIQKLSTLLADTLTPAVFVETSVGDHYVTSLIENVAAKGGRVRLGGRLFSDAMGHDGSYRGTYIGMIDHNITTITHALGGKAPKQGMLGLL